ncbi:Hypothetical protein A7982_05454 [Minicystis rosea]|nr:Hypothetical protein A7982_05454 [Minicystis rosea]
MSLRARFSPFALAFAALVSAGCSNENETTGPMTTTPDPCASMVSTCVGKQQACVSDGKEARCEACGAGKYASLAGHCEPLDGTVTTHDFQSFTTQPGEEVLGLCQSWTLNNAEEIWVNAVELTQDEASHHSNWTYVPDNLYKGEDGVWKCSERGYQQLDAAIYGGVLYAQSTQAGHEVQKFPGGAAVRIPPYSRIISDVHLLNTGSEAVTGHIELSLYSLPIADVKVKLVPFHLTYDGLNIPPHASSRFTGNCAIASQFPGGKLDLSVYYILPHTHAMATRFFVDVLGGPDDKKNLIEVKGFTSEAHGRAFDPPLDMSKADGFSFGCEYINQRSEAVGWGFGDQEMCELLGFADATRAFESSVDAADPAGTDENGMQLFSGPCSTFAFPWDHTKPGGPGPM